MLEIVWSHFYDSEVRHRCSTNPPLVMGEYKEQKLKFSLLFLLLTIIIEHLNQFLQKKVSQWLRSCCGLVEELEKINEKQEDQRFDPLPGQTKKGAK
jgi:hypothetical protein